MPEQTIQGFHLSPQQKHLWLLHADQPSTPFRASCSVTIAGPLDLERLRTAWQDVIERHEILRTTFQRLAQMRLPLQVVGSGDTATLRYDDLSALPQAQQSHDIAALRAELAQTAFDYEHGPLLHGALVKLGAAQHRLLLSLPALCADTVSLTQIIAELSHSYSAASASTDAVTQYIDFAQWQNETLETQLTAEDQAYWQAYTAPLPSLRLPFEQRSDAPIDFRPQCYQTSVSLSALGRINPLVADSDRTAAYLLAAWQVLLWRLSGVDDVLLGSADDGRKFDELADTIGPCTKYLPIRGQLDAEMRFSALVDQVQHALDDARAMHEYFSYEQLALPAIGGADQPGFEYCFDYVAPQAAYTADDLAFRIDDLDVCIDRYKLRLACTRTDTTLDLRWSYDAALYAPAAIERLAERYHTLLDSLENTALPLDQLAIVSAAEQQQLVLEFNQSAAPYAADHLIQQLFEAQVARTPQQTALVYADNRLSYAALNQRANQLAAVLREAGVGPETLVGICVERSAEMIEAVLGVLKAGGAYVPLDPENPPARLRYQLDDSRAAVLITHEPTRARFDDFTGLLICLDRDRERLEAAPTTNLPINADPYNAAYVIYTSGSTGTPKGVAITHQNLVNYTQFIAHKLGLNEPGTAAEPLQFAMVSTLAADLGLTVVFPALTSGGCLHVLPYETATDSARLASYTATQPLDVLKIVPSHLSALLSGPQAAQILPRRYLLVGGEACQPALAAQIAQLSSCVLINHYGPTETTVGALTYTVDDVPTAERSVPIGRPISNARAYILDHNLRPVPQETPGELYLGGAGVARGYWQRPALTAERFLPDPWSTTPGSRIYRTGDRARHLADGSIEFMGRLDDQIKLRGFRIEPGEIEAALLGHAAVRQAVIQAQPSPTGDPRLIAYLVRSDSDAPPTDALRAFLAEQLPSQMIPADFLWLERLPLTVNGKIDRAALPLPETQSHARQRAYVAPRTPVEELLAAAWKDVIGVPQVGVHDDFLELGGHSLLATQIFSRIREIFNVELPLRTLFENPTIERQAELIEAARGTVSATQTAPITPIARDGELPLSYAQQRLWFLDQLEHGNRAYIMAFTALVNGPIDLAVLERSVNVVVQRHETLRTTFLKQDGKPTLVILPDMPLTVPLIDLQHLSEAEQQIEVEQQIAAESRRSFDLQRGPLVRLTVLRLRETQHIMLLTMHHIVSDAWSMGMFGWDLATAYSALIQGTATDELPLPALPVQYVDYASWQRQRLQDGLMNQQLDYWRQQLGGPIPALELPTDRLRPATNTLRGAWHFVALPEPLTESLKLLAQREGTTTFITLFAAFVTLLYRYSGQTDILVGVPIANRTRREIEGLIGFFLNTLVFRTNLSDNPTFRELLAHVRDVALGAYEHQDLPFDQLVQQIHAERDRNRNPLFHVMFNYQNTPRRNFQIPGLDIEIREVDNGTAKFDLLLGLGDTPQGVQGGFEYNADLFDATTIERLAQHFMILLEGIVAAPDQRLQSLPLLPRPEQQQVLYDWNATDRPYPAERCLHELFEAQAARTPQATALIVGEQRLSYHELNQQSNQLAHYLRSLGVGGPDQPEALVGVCLERTADLVVGLLAILKAGGAFMPLDPTYPPERVEFMLLDANVGVLLTQRSLVQRLPQSFVADQQRALLCVDELRATVAQQPDHNPDSGVLPEHLDYVLYTSGSTGRPKGAMLQHHSTVSLIEWARSIFTPEDLAGMLASTSICFDSSILELFVPLSTGGTVILAENALQLPSLPAANAVTMVNTVPSAVAELIRMEGVPPSVRVISMAGEPVQHALAQNIYQHTSAQRVVNLYGLTEDTTYSTCAIIERDDPGPVTIGRPIDNAQAYILDQSLQPVPIGVLGELYISGVRLARGYLHRAGLTAERFVPNPFSDQLGVRMYQTGDLARFRPDGTIEFMGRRDHQVKIRGFRIELGEVEAALAQHPQVQDVVVIATAEPLAEKRLVAYIVPTADASPTIEALRSFLQAKLPSYMVPAGFMLIPALPLTPNGKVDRRALPAPDTQRPELEVAYLAPRTELETSIAAIWQNVLQVDQVGINDNFFDLGGHSLLVVQVHSALQTLVQRELPMVKLFEHPTIRAMAQYLTQEQPAQTAPQLGSDRANVRKALMQQRKRPTSKG